MDVDLKNRGPDIKREIWKADGKETHISSKCDEVRSGEVDAEVVVQLLFKHHLTVLWNTQTTPWTEWRIMLQVLTEPTFHRFHYKNIKSSWISNCGTPPLDINCGERHHLPATVLVNHSDVITDVQDRFLVCIYWPWCPRPWWSRIVEGCLWPDRPHRSISCSSWSSYQLWTPGPLLKTTSGEREAGRATFIFCHFVHSHGNVFHRGTKPVYRQTKINKMHFKKTTKNNKW